VIACRLDKKPKLSIVFHMYMTSGEAAEYLQVSLNTVKRWMDAGVLHGWVTPGGHYRVLATSVEAVRRHPAGQNVTVITTSEVE